MPIDPREPTRASQIAPDELERMRGQRCAVVDGSWLCGRDGCGAPLGEDDAIYCAPHENERADSARRRLAKHVKAIVSQQAEAFNAQMPPWDHAVAETGAFARAVHPRLAKEVHTFGNTNLAVFGPTGAGKTTFVIAMLRAHMRRVLVEWKAKVTSIHQLHPYVRIVWTTGHELVSAERRSPLGSEPEAIVRAKEAQILVVDEVGFEPRGTALFEVINHRYERQAGPTIVTSGLSPDEFADPGRYGAALYRRLVQKGIGRQIDLFSEDDA